VADQVLAFAPLVLSVAHDLDARAKAAQAKQAGAPPAWAIRQQRAFDRTQGTLNSVLIKAQGVRDGKNPLGIEDEDTPLYFLAANNLGPGKRFSAVSDYLIGDPGPNSTGWATSLTRQAAVTLDAAREAWSQQSGRELQDKLTSQQQLDRAADSSASYGEPILQMCGAIEGVNKYTAIDNAPTIHPETCWIRTELKECRVTAKSYVKTLTSQDVAYQVCVVGKLKRDMGGSSPATNIGFVDARYNALADKGCSLQSQLVVEGCASTAGEPCFRCIASSGAAAGAASEVAFRTDSLATNLAGVPDELKPRASAECLAQFPLAVPRLPNPQAASASLLDSGTCYKGSLGELALTVASAAKAAEAATSEIQDNLDSYGIAVESCNILQTANDTIISKTDEYTNLQSKLRAGKLASDIVASVASAGKDCATAAGSDIFFVAGVIACSAAALEGAAQSVSSGLQFAMDEATQSHDTLVQSLQLNADTKRCFNDAKLLLVNAKTTSLRASAASIDLDNAQLQFKNQKAQLQRLLSDGVADAQYVVDTTAPPAAFDFWFDERVSTFTRNMALAKRASYLAAKAVEYELQASVKVRAQILAAETPSELEAALDALRAVAAARRINGSAPSDLKLVLSLREQLLQIADRSGVAPGEQNLSEIERFRLYLSDARFKSFDAKGVYLGQRIPFSIAPLGSLNAGKPGAIAVFSKNDCAERLWSVNASIQGKGMFVGTSTTTARIDLLKSNSFYSQWCGSANGQPEFQVASVRPTRNLFLDPTLGASVGEGFGLANETAQFARARISAATNVERARMEDDSFANGQTSELAARGLYGDYAIFFAADVISTAKVANPGDPPERTPGLDLNKVDDILLRLDYVSVAR
jgi:hypothetical protein